VIVLGQATDLLRDSQPQDFGGATPGGVRRYRRTFSLAQTQMAWWFCIILGSYLYIACANPTSGSFPNFVDPSTLVLMGIGSGTALGAAMIEQVKGNQSAANQAGGALPETNLDKFNSDVKQLTDAKSASAAATAAVASAAAAPTDAGLAQAAAIAVAAATAANANLAAPTAERDALAPKIASTNFFVDILTDVDGISLHRFQAFVWTLVLGGIFVEGVIANTTMPTFNATMLALMGISNGAYLGFKVPETPS